MTKGENTRVSILDAGVELASLHGVTGVSLGALADKVGMSKSGLVAHFGNREALEAALLDHVADMFTEVVLRPALRYPRGVARLEAFFERWVVWATRGPLPGGCPLQSASMELDDRPGVPREHIAKRLAELSQTVARLARGGIETGELRADLDPEQFAFEAMSLGYGITLYHRLFHDPRAAERAQRAARELLERARAKH